MTEPVQAIGVTLDSAVATVLFLAAAWKMAKPEQITETLRDLGIAWPGAAHTVALTETLAGVALILAPESVWTALAVMGLGVAFAMAALSAILRRVAIDCACVGPALSGKLGLRQLALLPVWIASASAGYFNPSPLSLGERAQLLVVLVIAVSAVTVCLQLRPLALEHRTLRVLLERGH